MRFGRVVTPSTIWSMNPMHRLDRALIVCASAAALLTARAAGAHGFAGDRFFPPTIATDDPFAVDEFAFPTVSYTKNASGGGSPASHEVDGGFEFDKEIFPRFALGVSDTYIHQWPDLGHSIHGWQNLTVTGKYEIGIDAEHEAIISAGLAA